MHTGHSAATTRCKHPTSTSLPRQSILSISFILKSQVVERAPSLRKPMVAAATANSDAPAVTGVAAAERVRELEARAAELHLVAQSLNKEGKYAGKSRRCTLQDTEANVMSHYTCVLAS